ncbi:MAG: hypothetical protein WBB29_02890 [Geitlerinemataceae cyanobacterium]
MRPHETNLPRVSCLKEGAKTAPSIAITLICHGHISITTLLLPLWSVVMAIVESMVANLGIFNDFWVFRHLLDRQRSLPTSRKSNI